MSICNKDCLHCPYPDCINDDLDYEDYKAAAQIEREIILPRTAKQRKVAAQKKAYYEANREKVAAQHKAYREANREKVAAQKKIRDRRLAAGYTQRDLARLIGVTQPTVAHWETCVVPADWDKLRSIFPDI